MIKTQRCLIGRHRTYQKALALQQEAEIPRSSARSSRLVNDNSVQQTLAADRLDNGRLEGSHAIAEDVAQTLSIGSHVLLLENLQSSNGDGTAQGVAAVGRTVSSGLNNQHNLLAAEDGTDGVHASGDGLAESDNVGLDAGPLGAEKSAGTANAGLNLVADEEDVVLLAESVDLGQVVFVGDNNTSLTLNGLNDESGGVLAMGLQNLLQVGHVVVTDRLAGGGRGGANVGDIGAVVVLGFGVGGQSNGGHLDRQC